jgi:hypothetical protein
MNMASFLKVSANLLMGAALIKLLAGDMAAEVRRDVGTLRSRSDARLRASPYRAAAATAAMAAVAGILLAHRRRRA